MLNSFVTMNTPKITKMTEPVRNLFWDTHKSIKKKPKSQERQKRIESSQPPWKEQLSETDGTAKADLTVPEVNLHE